MKDMLELVITPPGGLAPAALEAVDDIRRACAGGRAEVAPALQGHWWYRRAGVAVRAGEVASLHAPGAASLRAPGAPGWQRFCADPVHLQLSGDAIVLDAGAAADLSPDEAAGLTALLNRHFAADGLAFHALGADQWIMESAAPLRATTWPPEAAHGRSIDAWLPHGPEARRLRQIGNEAQMLFHECPVNQAREARGRAPINALWLWGGGDAPAAAGRLAGTTIFSDRLHVHGLARAAGARACPLPAGGGALAGTDGAAIIDLFAAFADPCDWPERLAAAWLAPLRALARPARLVLDLPGACVAAPLFRPDPWRFLRRGGLAERLRAAGIGA